MNNNIIGEILNKELDNLNSNLNYYKQKIDKQQLTVDSEVSVLNNYKTKLESALFQIEEIKLYLKKQGY